MAIVSVLGWRMFVVGNSWRMEEGLKADRRSGRRCSLRAFTIVFASLVRRRGNANSNLWGVSFKSTCNA